MPVKHAKSYPRTPEALSEYNAKRDPEYLMEQAGQSYESGKTDEAARTAGLYWLDAGRA